MAPRVLVVDNYDSFVYNLVQYLGELGAEPEVVRNDEITVAEAVERARAADPKTGRIADGRSVADALRAGPMRTLLGPVGFDARGDRTGSPIVLRIWRRSPDGRLDYAGNEVAAP